MIRLCLLLTFASRVIKTFFKTKKTLNVCFPKQKNVFHTPNHGLEVLVFLRNPAHRGWTNRHGKLCDSAFSAASPILLSFSGTTEPPGEDRITLFAQQEHHRTVVNAVLHFGLEHPDFRFLSKNALSLSFLYRHLGRTRVGAR